MSATEKNLFKSQFTSHRYIFKDGKTAAFIDSKYLTDVESEIEELNHEIKLGHPTIYVDPDQVTIDPKDLDPLNAIRKSLREEIMQELVSDKGITNDGADMAAKLKGISTSVNTVAAAASSNSQ